MFTEFDVIVCVVVITSTLLSYLRGFIKDVLSFVAWVGAGVLTFVLFPVAASWMEDLFKSSTVVNVAAVIAVFLASLALLSLINFMIMDNLRNYRKGPLDSLLGFFFGLFRGWVIVSLMHFAVIVLAGDKVPEWLEEGQTYTLTEAGSDVISENAHSYIKKTKDDLKEKIDENKDLDEKAEEIIDDASDLLSEGGKKLKEAGEAADDLSKEAQKRREESDEPAEEKSDE